MCLEVELKIHHGGNFKRMPNLAYVNGDIESIVLDPDRISYPHLMKYITEDMYKKVDSLSFKLPDESLDSLRPLCDDATTLQLIEMAINHGVVEVYVEHGIDEPELVDNLGLPSTLTVGGNDTSLRVGAEHHNECEDTHEKEKESEIETNGEYEDHEEDIPSGDDQASLEGEEDLNDDNDDQLKKSQNDWVNSKGTGTSSESDFDGEEECSEYYDSEDPPSLHSDSENEEGHMVGSKVKKNMKCPSYNRNSDSKDLDLKMLFEDAREFKTAIINYAVHFKRDLRWVRNGPMRVQVACSVNCPFRCTGSWAKQYHCFQMKTWVGTHRCNEKFKLKIVSQAWLEEKYENKIIENPCIRQVELQKEIRNDLKISVNITKVKRVIARVLKKNNASFGDQFRRLRDYGAECLRSNPGSTIIVKTQRVTEDGPEVFQRMYVCFGALKRGFLSGCRQIIGLDGSFLKGLLKGEILSAVGRDANNEMYPIAWAVVEIENTDSWRWFLELLKEDLDINNTFHWTLMSDQQKVWIKTTNISFHTC
ncbi:unnamed protein product [Cuscuta epithymum]|uniref:MULE transposase domain-containing protein n=1 Tax=Cuscuta epithymum TaxID=186058 RepID=A0AAV0GKB4_9ASTE|nr:unnamed protein product [Cuscuta epithymum]